MPGTSLGNCHLLCQKGHFFRFDESAGTLIVFAVNYSEFICSMAGQIAQLVESILTKQ